MAQKEIKFRAWCKSQKKMYEIYSLSRDMSAVCLRPNGEMFCVTFDSKSSAVMQYSGLKDKYGREIFEGDILRYNYPEAPDCYVTFENGCFWVSDPCLLGKEAFLHEICGDSEVIGNIYENPDLLKNNELTVGVSVGSEMF